MIVEGPGSTNIYIIFSYGVTGDTCTENVTRGHAHGHVLRGDRPAAAAYPCFPFRVGQILVLFYGTHNPRRPARDRAYRLTKGISNDTYLATYL